MKFAIPEGMVPPDGATVGSTFDALATLKLGESDLELIAVDGLPVAGAEVEVEAEAPEAPSEEMGFEEAVRSGMMEV
jgi:hypothetical protein